MVASSDDALLPDGGPQAPWVRGRRTRWWLVVPADLIAVALGALFAAAALKDLSQVRGLLVGGVGGVILAWAVARAGRGRQDHLEVMCPDGWIVLSITWAVWMAVHGLVGGGANGSFAIMLAAFVIVFQGGWRCLYGYAKAHDWIVPRGVQRRLEAERKGRDEAEGSMRS